MTIGLPELMILLPIFLLALVFPIIWIWTLIDCVKNEPPNAPNRVMWIVIIACGNFIGGLIYILVRRPKRIQEYGR